MDAEQKKLNDEWGEIEKKNPTIITGQNVENTLNHKKTPVINEQIVTDQSAILG